MSLDPPRAGDFPPNIIIPDLMVFNTDDGKSIPSLCDPLIEMNRDAKFDQ